MSTAPTNALAGSALPDLDPSGYDDAVGRLTGFVVAVGVTIRLMIALVPTPIWGDEAMLALNIAARDYAGLTEPLDNTQVAPVLFLWAERFALVTLGPSEWALRLFPLLASLGALFLFRGLACRVLTPTGALLAVGLMALSPWPIGMANTLKPYSFDLFWSVLLLALAVRWRGEPGRLWPLAALVVVVPLALAGSYPAVFVAGAVAVYLLPAAVRAGAAAKFLYVWYAGAMFGAFAATYLLVSAGQVGPGAGDTGAFMRWYWRHAFPPDEPLQVPVWLLSVHTGRAFAYPIGDWHGASSATTALMAVGALVWWRTGRRSLLALCLIPFALNLFAAVLGAYPYAGCCRLAQHLAPAICLLAGSGGAWVFERWDRRRTGRLTLVRWAVGALVLLAVGGYVIKNSRPERGALPGFSRNLHRELAAAVAPEDAVVVFADPNTTHVLRWYLQTSSDRVVWAEPGTPLPDAPRMWVVSVGPNEDRFGDDRSAPPPPGWKVVTPTVRYACRGDKGTYGAWSYVSVTCLARESDPRPGPKLNVSP